MTHSEANCPQTRGPGEGLGRTHPLAPEEPPCPHLWAPASALETVNLRPAAATLWRWWRGGEGVLPGHEPTQEGQAQEHCSPGPQVARRAEPAQAAQVGALRTAAQSSGSLTDWRLPPPPGQQREQQGHSRGLGGGGRGSITGADQVSIFPCLLRSLEPWPHLGTMSHQVSTAA